MMNARIKPLVYSLLYLSLVGCGSDDDTSVVEPIKDSTDNSSVEVTTPIYDNLEITVTPNEKFTDDSYVTVYLHDWEPCKDNPAFCTPDGRNTSTMDDDNFIFKVYGKELKAHLGKSRTPEFADEQYSYLDVFQYVAETRDDFELEISEFDEEIGTYNYKVSFDYNRDGKFTLEGDGADNYKNDNWYARFIFDAAEFLRDAGGPAFETPYNRLDLLLAKDKMSLRFEPFPKQMTDRREYLWKKQVDRYHQNGNKIVVSQLRDEVEGTIFEKNIDVKAHNLRPDLFKEGTITLADVFMTANHELQTPISFTWWPTLSTGTRAGSYSVNQVEDVRASGSRGFNIYAGELESGHDFYRNLHLPSTDADYIYQDGGEHYCTWLKDEWSRENAEVCYREWFRDFGGNMVHIFIDTVVLRYPVETADLHFTSFFPMIWHYEENHVEDGKYQVYDVSEPVAPLTPEHFGWNVADCSTCHSIEDTHVKGDSPAIPDTAEPYYCAQCHGSNGAPEGHGETGRCFWCHSKDKAMTNHGDASKDFRIDSVTCDYLENVPNGPCADIAGVIPLFPTLDVHDKAGNYDISYPGDQLTKGNSDWHTSETFPDPYSCATCHPNK